MKLFQPGGFAGKENDEQLTLNSMGIFDLADWNKGPLAHSTISRTEGLCSLVLAA